MTEIALGPAKSAVAAGAIPSAATSDCKAIGVAVSCDGAVEATVSVIPDEVGGVYVIVGVESGSRSIPVTSVSSVAPESSSVSEPAPPARSRAGVEPATLHSPILVVPETASLNATVTVDVDLVAASVAMGGVPSAAVTVAAAMPLSAQSTSFGGSRGVNLTVGRASCAIWSVTRSSVLSNKRAVWYDDVVSKGAINEAASVPSTAHCEA
ncbi:MAG: hypothetical protein OXU61_06695 [Gammaproteobacteria bacterium]|nr:hypothetical protein [Gammaproteobacteria bacterium]